MKKLTSALLSLAAVSALMAAEPADYKYSITPMVGGEHGIAKDYLKNGTSLGARLGYNFDAAQSVELGYDFLSGVDYKNIANQDTDVQQITLNYLYTFYKHDTVQPYLLAGVGYEDYSDALGKVDDGGLGDIGVGMKVLLTKAMSLRLELRDLIRFDDGGHTLAYTAGLHIPFGKVEKAAPVAAPAPVVEKPMPPLDTDGDGVIDSKDKCPHTPMGTIVDDNGCPLDSDHDGVPDNLDKCPATPSGVSVDAKGCPLDSDNDGVADFMDKCPTTPKGFKVDKLGCAVGFTIHVNFATNSAKIASEYTPEIDRLAKFLKEHPESKVILEGYTDSMGSAAYNLKLSLKRANAVKAALVAQGVDASRITTKGLGEDNPIASNDTPEGRAQNRRVEAIIVPTKR